MNYSQSGKHKLFINILFISLLFFIFNFNLFCESERSQADTLRYYRLEGIRIIAEKPQENIGSVTQKEFSPRLPYRETNIAEAVKDIAGLHIATGGKAGSELTIRGFSNERIKFLLDGRPLGGGYFSNVDLNTIPISEIKQIQVLKGPVSSIYGSDTIGGVVNIITRNSSNNSWMKAGFQAKRNNTNKIYLSSSHDLGNWDYWLYLSRYHTDGFMLSDEFVPTLSENGAVRNFTARNQWDFQTKINMTLFDFHSFGLQAGYTFMDKKQIPSSIYENRVRDFLDWQRWQFSALASLQMSPYWVADLNVYYDQYDDTYAEYNAITGEMYPSWPSYLESWIFGVYQKNELEIDNSSRMQWGYKFEKEVYNRKDNGNYLDWTSNNQLKNNGFWQWEQNWSDFTFSLGSGLSFFKPKGRESWQHNLEPSAGIYLDKGWSLALSASSNIRYPSLHQLFSSSSGNLDLKEERAAKSELAIGIPFSNYVFAGSVEAAVFYNDVSDLIDKHQGVYRNIENVRSYGLENTLKLKFLWQHEIDFSFIEFTDKQQQRFLEVPNNKLNIKETIPLPFDVNAEYGCSWTDVRYATDQSNQMVTMPSYWLHDLYFSRNWKNLKILCGIENILDRDYFEKYGYPGPGRNFVVNVEVEL